MGEIPEDIMRVARMHADGVSFCGYEENTLSIANAILAERQRCADVAQKEGDGYKAAGLPQSAMGAYTVRRAILNQ